jgi:hypothetical protein
MTRDEYLALCAKRYDELKAINRIDNFYDYESEFAMIMKDLSNTTFTTILQLAEASEISPAELMEFEL